MAGTLGDAQEVLADAYGSIKANPRELILGMVKLNIGGMALAMLALVPAGIIAFLAAGAGFLAGDWSQAAGPALLLLLAAGIPLLLLAGLIMAACKSVGYNLVADLRAGKRTDLVAQAKKNFVPVSRLTLLIWAAMALFAVPVLLPLALGSPAGALAACGLAILFAAAYATFMFLVQFAEIEVVLGGRGAIGAMKASAGIVKNGLLVVLLLDLVMFAVNMGVSAPGSVVQALMRPLLQMLAAMGGAAMVAGFVAYLAVVMAVYAVLGAVMQAVCISVFYSYWKKTAAPRPGAGSAPPASGTQPPASASTISGPGFTAKPEEKEQLPMVVAPPGPIATIPAETGAAAGELQGARPAARAGQQKKPAARKNRK